MSREWATLPAALAKAKELLGPVWFGRALVILRASAYAENAGEAARRGERERLRRAILASSEERLKGRLLAVLEEHEAKRPTGASGWNPVRGPDVSRASRAGLARALAGSRTKRDPAFPGPTAWALFDVGTGLSAVPRDLAAWRRLVASWGTQLRAVGLGTGTARKRRGGKS